MDKIKHAIHTYIEKMGPTSLSDNPKLFPLTWVHNIYCELYGTIIPWKILVQYCLLKSDEYKKLSNEESFWELIHYDPICCHLCGQKRFDRRCLNCS